MEKESAGIHFQAGFDVRVLGEAGALQALQALQQQTTKAGRID